MAKPRQIVITVDFHFTREKRGTDSTKPLALIERSIRRLLSPWVVVDNISHRRTDVPFPLEVTDAD